MRPARTNGRTDADAARVALRKSKHLGEGRVRPQQRRELPAAGRPALCVERVIGRSGLLRLGVEAVHGGGEPDPAITSTASAAIGGGRVELLAIARREGRWSTWSAPAAGPGLANPDPDPREPVGMEVGLDRAKPLWPASAATELYLEAARRQVELVVQITRLLGVLDARSGEPRARPRPPSRSCRWWAPRARTRLPPIRTSSTGGPLTLHRAEPAACRARRASSLTASAPTLCRVPANSVPGFPRPTTNRSGRRPWCVPSPDRRPESRSAAAGLALVASIARRRLALFGSALGGRPRYRLAALGGLTGLERSAAARWRWSTPGRRRWSPPRAAGGRRHA